MSLPFESLKKEEDFQKIREEGRSWRGNFVRIASIPSDLEISRVGIVVSKKVSKKAVVRNKLRRQVKAILSEELKNKQKKWDLAVIAQNQAAGVDFPVLKKDLVESLTKVWQKWDNEKTGFKTN